MSFWAGVAKGFKDAKEAKAEKDELEARRAERQSTFEYNKARDSKADERYENEQTEDLRRWQLGHDIQVKTYDENKAWRESQAAQAQANLETTWTREDKYKDRAWALELDKFDFKKSSYQDGKKHADKVFSLTIEKFDYTKSQDVIANLRKDEAEARQIAMDIYQKERDKVGDGVAEENRQFRLKQFENQVKQQGITNDQWEATFNLKKEEIELQRTSQLLSMIPSSLSNTMAGDGKGSAGSKGHAMSKEAMVTGSKLFKAEYSTLSDEAKESDFFKAAANSPATQATLMAFVEAQAKKGNTVNLEELPKYFKYAGSTEGQGSAKAKETIDALMSGEMDVNDKDAFIKGLMSLKNYKPAEELFVQTGTPDDLKTKAEKIKYWETAIETDAYRKLDSFPPEDRRKIDNALTGLQIKARRTQSLDVLASYGLGMGAVDENNMRDIGVIKSYYGDKLDAPVVAEAEPEAIVARVDENLPMSSNATDDAVFEVDSVAAFREAKDSGYTGPIKYKGVTYAPKASETSTTMLSNDAGEELDLEDALAADFGEGGKLKESGAVEKVFDQQAEGLSRMGKGTTEEQVEGSKPGEKEIDTETFVDRSFQGEGDEAMDLSKAPTEVVTDKIMDVVDAMPPRTPKAKRKEWAMKEFRKRYLNADISEEELEVKVDTFLEFANQ